MSKAIYFRETDPQTGKQKWIRIDGITGNFSMIFINKDKFEKIDDNLFIVYKSTRTKVRK